MLSRRSFVATTLALPLHLHAAAGRASPKASNLTRRLEKLEHDNGGRLGVLIHDLETGEFVAHRAEERFPMCSTFKFLLAAQVLQRVDDRKESLERSLPIPPMPLLFNSPLTEPHAGKTMTISALCHAILTRSDNTAANLLLDEVGGPSGLTAFARSIGDEITRLDRMELELNECLPDDPRDTTSPKAMTSNLNAVLLGDVLSARSRHQITEWMQANVTGLERLRAHQPKDWRTADKTGANGSHTSNDIAVLWPPKGKPILVAAYITQCEGPEKKRSAMLAEIGRLARQIRT